MRRERAAGIGWLSATPPTGGNLAASVTPRSSQATCTDVNVAWEQTAETLDVLGALTSDEAWAAALAPDSPVKLDPEAFAGWIEVLSTLPGQDDTAQVLRAVVPLYRAAVKSGKPFSEASNLGRRLHDSAQDAAALARAEIVTAMEIRGCEGF